MKKRISPPIIVFLTLLLAGCAGPATSTSDSESDDEFTFCEDDSSFFVFDQDDTLGDAIDELEDGTQTDEERDAILEILGTNDGYANHVVYNLEITTDYDTLATLDDDRDFFGEYGKEVSRYDAEKILVGTYDVDENYYDETETTEVTIDLTADYQVFRNGFCPSLSRFYEIYDFAGVDDDVAIESVYGTENYMHKLYLIDGQAKALELNNLFDLYQDNENIELSTFTANKFASKADGEVDANPALNTSTSLELVVAASYDPAGSALGGKAIHSVLIVDGMIKKVSDFSGTFEIVGPDEVYRTFTEKTAIFSVEDIGAFGGTLLDPEDFTFSSTPPNL